MKDSYKIYRNPRATLRRSTIYIPMKICIKRHLMSRARQQTAIKLAIHSKQHLPAIILQLLSKTIYLLQITLKPK